MTNTHRITSIAGLVNALGVEAICANLHVDRQEVARWVAANHIPNGWHLRLYLAAVDRQIDVDAFDTFEVGPWAANAAEATAATVEWQITQLIKKTAQQQPSYSAAYVTSTKAGEQAAVSIMKRISCAMAQVSEANNSAIAPQVSTSKFDARTMTLTLDGNRRVTIVPPNAELRGFEFNVVITEDNMSDERRGEALSRMR